MNLNLSKQQRVEKFSQIDLILDYISDRKEMIRFKRDFFIKLTGPIVYVFWRIHYKNNEKRYARYVGRSSTGIRRPLEFNHHKRKDLFTSDELEIIFCETVDETIELEKALI